MTQTGLPTLAPTAAPAPARAHWWILVVALSFFLATTLLALALSMRSTGGRIVYALDDPYIHMAMARHVVQHGVWGISSSGFTSSSSSPMWTAVLSLAFLVFGIRDAIPLVANVLLGIAVLWVVFRQLRASAAGRHPMLMLASMMAIVLVTPLLGLVFVGLEHLLHALITLLFVDRFGVTLARERPSISDRGFLTLAALAAALPLIRFESIFLIAIVSMMLLVRRRWLEAGVLTLAMIAPLLIYGVISVSHGWLWLPNSVIMKGSRPSFATLRSAIDALGYIAYTRLLLVPTVGWLLFATLATFAARLAAGARDVLQWKLALCGLLILAHMQYAQPEAFWFYRYEAYLIILSLVLLAQAAGTWLDAAEDNQLPGTTRLIWATATLLLLAFSPLAERAVRAFSRIPQATTNIYEQQYQTGLFLRRYYDGAAVALNDIGAPSYLADIETIDLVGLANMEVARRRLRGWYFGDDIEEVAASSGVRIAVVYDSWFGGNIPKSWVKAGTWRIRNNVVTGGDEISFYAVRPSDAELLRRNLREFGEQLPPDVVRSIL